MGSLWMVPLCLVLPFIRLRRFSTSQRMGEFFLGFLGGVLVLHEKFDGYIGKFSWKINNFTKLKDLLIRKRIKNLCIKSRKFLITSSDFRLLLYPRGKLSRAS